MAEARQAVQLLDRKRGFPRLEGSHRTNVCRGYFGALGFVSDKERGVLRLSCSVPHPARVGLYVKTKARYLRNLLLYGLSPLSPVAVWIVVFLIVALVNAGGRDSWLRQNMYARLLLEAEYRLSFEWWKQSVPFDLRVLIVAAVGSLILLILFMALQRMVLSKLLQYRAYLFLLPGQTRPWTLKIWGFLVNLLVGNASKRLTYSYQSALPALPLPPLKQTCERFLESMRPLSSKEEYSNLRLAAKRFLDSEGRPLQKLLEMRKMWYSNYVTSWWETFVYLRNRQPLLVNSNYYICDGLMGPPTCCQSARAASLTSAMLAFRELIVTERLAPRMLKGLVPLCMRQYARTFNTTRVPGREIDDVVHRQISRHIVVVCRNFWWRLTIQGWDGVPYSAWQLQQHFEAIRKESDALHRDPSVPPPPPVAALTSCGRTHWADVRERFLSDGTNRQSLNAIERAAFVVVLEDEAATTWTERARRLLCGDGSNLWLDKSLNLVVFPDGHAGIHAEHSWADALIPAHMWEWCVSHELRPCSGIRFDASGRVKPRRRRRRRGRNSTCVDLDDDGYNDDDANEDGERRRKPDGRISRSASYAEFMNRLAKSQNVPVSPMGSPIGPKRRKRPKGFARTRRERSADDAASSTPGERETTTASPIRLSFDFDEEGRRIVDRALVAARKLIDDTNVAVFQVDIVARNQMKSAGVSPDAFVQLALQLAYYRDQGHFTLTYEATMTRLFLEGRTETVRSVTSESCAFVRAAIAYEKSPDGNAMSKSALAKLLRKACATHRRKYIECLGGGGVDRHLFALYVASRTMRADEEPPALLRMALKQSWLLSTSQQPQVQAPEIRRLVPDALKNYSVSPGGGFGPVADDGYGVSYMFVDLRASVFFHVSSKQRSTKTDSKRFCANIARAFSTMKEILGVRP